MLIAFVLLGKNLEQRAKLKAASDMTGLLNILPSKARLMVDNDAEQSSFTEVPCGTLAVGDYILVLPGVSKYKSHRQTHILMEVFTHVFFMGHSFIASYLCSYKSLACYLLVC